jgi:hypothetical protein
MVSATVERAGAGCLALGIAAATLAAACGAPQPPGLDEAGSIGAPETGVHRCKVSKDTARPMLVEWPAVEKAALQARAAKGLVVVRYDGCRLKQLPRCKAEGGYEFVETSRAQDGFVVKDKTELFARLPLGAVSLEGEINQGKQLSLSYVAVGARSTDVSRVGRERLEGECDGATHFVRTMVVGAYALGAEAALGGGAGVSVGGAGTGGSHEKSTEVIRRDGNLEDCLDEATPAEDKRCQAIVQLILEPVSDENGEVYEPEPVERAAAPPAAAAPIEQPQPDYTPVPQESPVATGPQPRARYRARLSEEDHYSTDGSKLRAASLVIRQDRYNYHAAGRRDAEDEDDPVLGAKAKRAKLQGWLKGRISPDVEQRIMNGTPLVEVSLFQGRAEVRVIED